MWITADFFLARYLPHRAARRVGAALGGLASRLPGDHRRRGSDRLRAAFPDLDRRCRTRLARRSFRHQWRAISDGASACRFDARALCRRLTLDGWDRLEAAESQGRGVLMLGARYGCWQLAALAVALYRGPIETLGPWRTDPVFGRLAAAFERSSGGGLFGELAGGGQLQWSLRAGDRVGWLAGQSIHHGETAALTFLGRQLRAETLVARAAIDTGAPIVPVFGFPEPRGRWRVSVREPIRPRADADPKTLTEQCFATVEREVRCQPELWPWWQQNL